MSFSEFPDRIENAIKALRFAYYVSSTETGRKIVRRSLERTLFARALSRIRRGGPYRTLKFLQRPVLTRKGLVNPRTGRTEYLYHAEILYPSCIMEHRVMAENELEAVDKIVREERRIQGEKKPVPVRLQPLHLDPWIFFYAGIVIENGIVSPVIEPQNCPESLVGFSFDGKLVLRDYLQVAWNENRLLVRSCFDRINGGDVYVRKEEDGTISVRPLMTETLEGRDSDDTVRIERAIAMIRAEKTVGRTRRTPHYVLFDGLGNGAETFIRLATE